MLVYFSVNAVKELNFFKNFFNNLKEDRETIKNHYLNEFSYFYYFRNFIRVITFFVFFSPLYIYPDVIAQYLTTIGLIYRIFIIVTIIDVFITIFIIFFRNTPTTNPIVQTCIACATGAGVVFILFVTLL